MTKKSLNSIRRSWPKRARDHDRSRSIVQCSPQLGKTRPSVLFETNLPWERKCHVGLRKTTYSPHTHYLPILSSYFLRASRPQFSLSFVLVLPFPVSLFLPRMGCWGYVQFIHLYIIMTIIQLHFLSTLCSGTLDGLYLERYNLPTLMSF